jgi:hypothetical protein
MDKVGLYESNTTVNDTGSWTNILVTSFFGLAPDNDFTFPAKTANISIVNYLAHGIGKAPIQTGTFLETAFRSDVHVVECGFVNTLENGTEYQANAAGGSYTSAVQGVSGVSFLTLICFVGTSDLSSSRCMLGRS